MLEAFGESPPSSAAIADHQRARADDGVAPMAVLGGEGERSGPGLGEDVGGAVRSAGTSDDDACHFRIDPSRAVIDLDDPGGAIEGDLLLPDERGVGGFMPEDQRPASADEVRGAPVDGVGGRIVRESNRTIRTEGGESTLAGPLDLIDAGAKGAEVRSPAPRPRMPPPVSSRLPLGSAPALSSRRTPPSTVVAPA